MLARVRGYGPQFARFGTPTTDWAGHEYPIKAPVPSQGTRVPSSRNTDSGPSISPF